MPRKRQSRHAQPPAFSLIETLVVVGIIAILVSLVIAGGAYMNIRAKQTQTRGVLAALAAIDTEYRAQTEKTVNDGVSSSTTSPVDWTAAYTKTWPQGLDPSNVANQATTNSTSPYVAMERFIVATLQISETRAMIENLINNMKDVDNNSFAEVTDAWGRPIEYRTQAQDTDIFRAHPTPFFVSAGPDGQIGSVKTNASAGAQKQALDNLYSYDLE